MELVGLNELKEEMVRLTKNADLYKKYGMHVPNFILNIGAGNGQSTVAQYVTEILYKNKMRSFCGMDSVIEYRLDGALNQMKRIFDEDIPSSAIYTNNFEGVIAFDISGLSNYSNEYQVDYFFENITKISQNATIIIFYDNSLGKKMEIIVNRLSSCLENMINIKISPFSLNEFAEIALIKPIETGLVDYLGYSREKIIDITNAYLEANSCTSVKQACLLAERMIFTLVREPPKKGYEIEKGVVHK